MQHVNVNARRARRQSALGAPGDGLLSDAILPAQLQWSGVISPARALALAVLGQAVADTRDQRFARRRGGQRAYWEAYQWITADDRDWPYSFVNLCAALGFDIDSVRRHVLDAQTSAGLPTDSQTGRRPLLGKAA